MLFVLCQTTGSDDDGFGERSAALVEVLRHDCGARICGSAVDGLRAYALVETPGVAVGKLHAAQVVGGGGEGAWEVDVAVLSDANPGAPEAFLRQACSSISVADQVLVVCLPLVGV